MFDIVVLFGIDGGVYVCEFEIVFDVVCLVSMLC